MLMLIHDARNDSAISSKYFMRFILNFEKDINPQPAYGFHQRKNDWYDHWDDFSEAHKNNPDLTYEQWAAQRQ